jgi:hypothetical protein
MKPMRFLVCLLPFVILSAGTVSGASERLGDLQLSITAVSASGSLTVRMTNSSRRPLRIWTEANSWGALKWKVAIVRNGRVRTVFEDPDGFLFSKNTPQFEELAPGGRRDRTLDVNGKYWLTAGGGKIRFQSGDRLIVTYDILPEQEARYKHVWFGAAAASIDFK